MSAPAATPNRLARLLNLVPYLRSHPGCTHQQLADAFGISREQVVTDIELLFLTGLPGYSPGDLIDISIEGDTVTLTDAQTLDRPLRLTADEAVVLLVAIRALAEIPGIAEVDALERARVKIEHAAGAAAGAVAKLDVAVEAPGQVLTEVRRALEQQRRLHLSYLVEARDQVTERDVDPVVLHLREGRSYLEGYCRLIGARRLFRLDRVVALTVLDHPAEVPADSEPLDLDAGLYRANPADLRVVLELAPAARWVAEHYPCTVLAETPDGGLRIELLASDTARVERLLLRVGRAARVLEPAGLADAVRASAAAALENYGRSSTAAEPD